MQYAQFFRSLREQKGLTHEALAKLARCHRNTIINVENGRRVKLQTITALMGKMGYPGNSPETASLALLWLEAATGLDFGDPVSLGPAKKKLAAYSRNSGQATKQLLESLRRSRLPDRQIRLLIFAAEHPEILAIIDSVRDLLQSNGASELVELKVAED